MQIKFPVLGRVLMSLILLIGALSQPSYAQQTITIAGKEYVIRAFEELAFESKPWDFEGVEPIEKSRHTFEIRFTFYSGMNRRMIALRGNKNQLWADCYFYPIIPQRKVDSAFTVSKFKSKQGYPMTMLSKKIELTPQVDSIFASLLGNNIFTLKDEDVLLDSLKTNNIPYKRKIVLDGYWGTFFTVKVDKQYRQFRIDPAIDSANPTMEVFAERVRLFELFGDLYDSSGLPGTGW